MAWLSGLADKAEDLLNKIDKNTAAVLNKDKYDTCQVSLTDVTWVPPSQPGFDNDMTTRPSNLESSKQLKHPSSVSNLRSLTPSIGDTCKDENLLVYLNMPTISSKEILIESTTSPPTPSSLLVEHPTDTTDSVSEISANSGKSSPEFICTHINVDSGEKNATIDAPMNEVICESVEVDKLLNSSTNNYTEKYLKTIEKDLKEENELLEKQATDHQKQILLLNEKLKSVEIEKLQLTKQTTDLQAAIDRSRLELLSTRSELEQHRARALRILQDKEKLIAELKSNVSSGEDDATLMELNQLRQERDTLREENQQTHEQLRLVREELSNADLNLEKIRQKSIEENLKVQEILATERRKRLDAEEIATLHSEEIRSLKDELARQRNNFTIQLQKQDKEMSRLRLQLSASSTPSSEVESRLTSLTQTLVLKQQALESLTTERNALRLQLEKLEHEFRTAIGNSRRNVSYNNMNDTDDAKAQVPTFLMETPFDTGVTRRVKRAYSSLDAISVRTGVFLRRYPLARILVLVYMALLQFWVLVVLLSQSPEVH